MARHTHCKRIWWNISCNYTSRTDNTTITDRNSSAYGDISCNPAVVANGNRFGIFFISRSAVLLYILISVLLTKRMYRCKKRNIRTKKYIFANCHRATVNTNKVEICIGICSNGCKATIIELNRSLKIKGIPGYPKLLNDFCTTFICFKKLVVFFTKPMSFCSKCHKFFVGRVIYFPRYHFFFFSHL